MRLRSLEQRLAILEATHAVKVPPSMADRRALSRHRLRGVFWLAIAAAFIAVGLYHIKASTYAYPDISVPNFPTPLGDAYTGGTRLVGAPNPLNGNQSWELGGPGGFTMGGISIGEPLADFERAFNLQLEEQNHDHNAEFTWAYVADLIGAAAAGFSAFLEFSAVKESSQRETQHHEPAPNDNQPRRGTEEEVEASAEAERGRTRDQHAI